MIYLFYQGTMLRLTGAAVVSFLIVLLLGPRMIRLLVKRKVGDRPEFDHADLNQLTRHKSMTPTMGGILIVIAIFLSVLLFADLGNMYIRMGLVALVWLGGMGAVDDWMKLRQASGKGSRDGLRMWEKMVFQIGLVVLLSIGMRNYGSQSFVPDPSGQLVNPTRNFYMLFRTQPIYLAPVVYILFNILTMVGASNAVNITDGMDGLAAGCLVIVAGVFLLLSWAVGVRDLAMTYNLPLVAGSREMTVFCASMLGACLGFLWYNAHPAHIFMGDTGSLALGGLLGYIAIVTRQEMLLIIAGGVFVIEAGSVILQVSVFKLTKGKGGGSGKRVFRCAPLHHHFHLSGWAETKVVTRFWVLGIIFATLALATLKLR